MVDGGLPLARDEMNVDMPELPAFGKQTILVVDDEADILESLKDLFEASLDHIQVRVADSGAGGIALLQREPVDLIVTDYKMPRMNGLEFLDEAKKLAPNVPRILVTAFPDLDIAIKAINDAGIENFFTKPLVPDQVIDVVRSVLYERRAKELRDRSFARSLDMLRRRLEQQPGR
jgi:DNA-binding NtrC family response regulator